MKKFLLTFLFTILFCGTCFISTAAAQSSDLKYYKVLSASQRESICSNLRSAQSSTSGSDTSLGSDVIPDVVLTSIYNTTRNISGSVSLISVLGDALMCHSIHAARNTARIAGIELFDYPKFSIWIPGFLIYIVAFFLVLSITFYVVDIAFKLGFAVLMLPIAIALWPFPPTKSKLNTIISIILNNAAIFIFLAVAVSFTLNMIMVAVGDLSFVFEAIDTNNTDAVAETFTLTSTDFLVIFAALVYGMKLISNTAKDFTNKFFPDQVFKGESPIHGSMTQGLDFINKKVVQPAFTLGRDIARTQTGKLVEKGGAFLAGDYHQQVVSFIHNPKASFKKAGYKVASKLETAAGGVTKVAAHGVFGARKALTGLVPGKENREQLKNQINSQQQAFNEKVDTSLHQATDEKIGQLNEQIQQDEAKRNANPNKLAQLKKKSEEWHLKNQTEAEQKIDNLNQKRDAHLIKTDKFDTLLNNLADRVKNNYIAQNYRIKVTGKIDNATQSIKGWKQNINTDIDKKFSDEIYDGWGKRTMKKATRGAMKGMMSLAVTPALLTTKTASFISKTPDYLVQGVVDVTNKTIQTLAQATVSLPNAVVRTVYGIQKIPANLQKTGDIILQGIENSWKAPGKILKNIGQSMQKNKPNAYTPYEEDKEERKHREAEEKDKLNRDPS